MKLAFYKGRARLFNKVTSTYLRGPYSHCELVLEANECVETVFPLWQRKGEAKWTVLSNLPAGTTLYLSSSGMDGGVRIKTMALNPANWDIIDIECSDEVKNRAFRWFIDHCGQPYDYWGLAGYFIRSIKGNPDAWYCSEAIAESIGYKSSWRVEPNILHDSLQAVQRLIK